MAAAFLRLVSHHAIALAKFTIGFQLAVPTTIAFGLMLSGNAMQGLFAGALAALTFAVFYFWRNEIGVASKLLSVAGHGLAANLSLIGLAIALSVASVFLALPPLFGTALGFADGDVVPNPVRQGREACSDEFGVGVPCCAWQPRPWAMLYMALTALAAAWTMFTANQVRVYVVSGTIAQWYFSSPGTPSTGYAARSLRHALTSSFGTNAFAGLILTFTNAVRQQAYVSVEFLLLLLHHCLSATCRYFVFFFKGITFSSFIFFNAVRVTKARGMLPSSPSLRLASLPSMSTSRNSQPCLPQSAVTPCSRQVARSLIS